MKIIDETCVKSTMASEGHHITVSYNFSAITSWLPQIRLFKLHCPLALTCLLNTYAARVARRDVKSNPVSQGNFSG